MTVPVPGAAAGSAPPSPGRQEAAGVPSGATARRPVALVASAAVLIAFAVTAAGIAFTGAAAPSLLEDAGPLVRWGLPLVTVTADLSAATTIGGLVLALVALPASVLAPRVAGARAGLVQPGRPVPRPRLVPDPVAVRLVLAGSVAWGLATTARAILSYADTAGRALDSPGFGGELAAYLRQLDAGRGMVVTVAAAVLISLGAAAGPTLGACVWLLLLAVVGLVPAALAGHAASAGDHETAVTALGLHLLGTCVWVGGVVTLAVAGRRLAGPALAAASSRFSAVAGWCFLAVAASGMVNAWLRLGGLAGLETRYGVLVVAKVAATVALGLAGLAHRRSVLPRLASGDGPEASRALARLLGVELAVMGATIGAAVALGRSQPPDQGGDAPYSLVQSLTGYPMPPAPDVASWFTLWQPDLLWIVVCGALAGAYGAGVARLHRRGDRWPLVRTIAWFAGLAVVVYVTSGPPAAYGRVLFSAHMVGHMVLSMVAPLFLVLAAPVTLALRALPPREDGSRGPREWIAASLEAPYLRLVSRPVIAAVLFAGSLVVFYYTGLFGLALRTHTGHELMHVHFLLAGYLFAWVVIGVDPGPHRPPYPLRLVLLLATMAFHALFGVALMAQSTPLQEAWFAGLGRSWGGSPLDDQRLGGGLAWGLGEVPTLVMAVVLAVQWGLSDDREARRRDRRAARDGDSELVAYNAMLADLAERDRRP